MRAFVIALSGALLAPAVAPAQPTRAAVAQVDPQAVVSRVRAEIAERYVLPERRAALDAVLAEGLSSGRYRTSDAPTLAERINEDLTRVGRDRHLNFTYAPDRAAQLLARRSDNEPDRSEYEREVRARNHGIHTLRVLPGNVRYMDYRGFDWIGPESAAALETAMRFLSGGDAVIIDLRRNGGGSPQAVQYLVSHFMEADRPLVTFHFAGRPGETVRTLADVPAGRMVGKPLYVLTSNGTGSAAEEFVGHVAGYRLGEIVGDTTGGAGFRNELVPVEGGFVFSVSVGRAVLASTGRDWEAVGIAPTVRTDVTAALEAAQSAALRRLAAAAPAAERARLEGIADTLAAAAERRPTALPLAAYAGSYGERSVVAEEARLFYRRGNRAPVALVSLGGNRFAFADDPVTQLVFAATGASVSAFEMGPLGGPVQGRYERTR